MNTCVICGCPITCPEPTCTECRTADLPTSPTSKLARAVTLVFLFVSAVFGYVAALRSCQ